MRAFNSKVAMAFMALALVACGKGKPEVKKPDLDTIGGPVPINGPQAHLPPEPIGRTLHDYFSDQVAALNTSLEQPYVPTAEHDMLGCMKKLRQESLAFHAALLITQQGLMTQQKMP